MLGEVEVGPHMDASGHVATITNSFVLSIFNNLTQKVGKLRAFEQPDMLVAMTPLQWYKLKCSC
jgi:hypothetical protein